MVSTPVNLSLPERAIISRQGCNRLIAELQSSFTNSVAMAIVCLTFVTVFVPENPEHLASICEKHNPAIACRVW